MHKNILKILCFLHFIATFAYFAHAQSINISNFYYRDYLDFGQNKGVFKEGAESSNGVEIIGKNGNTLTIPHIPTFQASSNNGSLTNVGRGFVVTANHVVSAEQQETNSDIRKWGLTQYTIGQTISATTGQDVHSHSDPYGHDEKFLRFNKYIVEGQVEMLDIDNNLKKNSSDTTKEQKNIEAFNQKIKDLADSDGKTYIFQAGLGVIDLRNNYDKLTDSSFKRRENGETKGGGFGYIQTSSAGYYDLILCEQCQGLYGADYKSDTRGIKFTYIPQNDNGIDGDFNNRITSGDSGSGIYAYDSKNQKWILVGVTSSAIANRNPANVAAVSQKDLTDYQSKFEQKINLVVTESGTNTWTLNNSKIENVVRGDTPKQEHTLIQNKDIIFSGGGTIEVTQNITRVEEINYDTVTGGKYNTAGGFVFESSTDSTKPTTYTFKNQNGGNYSFKGSGLDIGENVRVEWYLKNPDKDESLHKVGKGELIIKTQNTETSNLGTLKIGEGKVTLDTTSKAFDNIYITSGRGELELTQDKAEALGATSASTQAKAQNATQSTKSYTLPQSKNSEMGFYFGTGGGKLDLGGNSLTLNTIAANDRFAVLTSANQATVEIEGFGYKTNGDKDTSKKENTIIHASVGEIPTSNTNENQANIDLKYSGNTKNDTITRHSERSEESTNENTDFLDSSATKSPQNDNAGASLIFDGNINTQGKLEVSNGNVALQGHATAHATIGDSSLIEKIKNAENGTSKGMPDYMDLSKPSTLSQPDWDNRSFKFGNDGIELNNSNLTLGRNASLESNITLDSTSKVTFGGGVAHFIDNFDGKNVTGSGFSYQQKVESGNLTGEALNGANESISYKGTITANGGTITSSIFDFRASLDLKDSANLTADYLTIEKSSSVKLASGTSASVKTLKLSNVSNSDLSNIFNNGNGGSQKLQVTDRIWFENTNDLTLTQLDSANITKSNYDIWATKSSVNDTSKDLSANVSLFETSNFTLKSLTLKQINGAQTKSTESSTDSTKNTKNRVYLGNTSTGSDFTKLTLSENLRAENLDFAQVELRGKSELKAQSIEFSNVKDGKLIVENESKLTGTNGNANIKVSGENSNLNIYFDGEKNFDIDASGASSNITLGVLQNMESNAKSTLSQDSMPLSQNATPSAKFSGKITAKDSSVVASAIESITASVDLSGSAKLEAKNIMLDSTYNNISLKDSANLTADKISANNLSEFKLTQENGAKLNVKNIELKQSTLKATTLTFDSAESSIITSDKESKLEVTNLKVTSGNLTLDFNDSAKNAQSLTKIDISNGGSVSFAKQWDFANATTFSSNGGGSKITFNDATYTHSGSTKTINADSAINGNLTLSSVGKSATQQAQNTNSASTDSKFETLKFENKNITFGENSSISVTFDDSVKKGANDITLDKYFTLLSAGSVNDNRADKRIDFHFAQNVTPLFVVSKFYENKLLVKFLESNPRSFSELSKHISSTHTKTLLALTEHNPNDENIDKAARTEEYSALESTLANYEEAMGEIATQSSGENISAILQNNDLSIKMRIWQVRSKTQNLATQKPKNLRLASALSYSKPSTKSSTNSTKAAAYTSPSIPQSDYDDISALLGVAPKSPPNTSLSLYQNSAWASALGGYAGTSEINLAFYGSSVGYDRIVGSTLLGVMASFGGSHLLQKNSKQSGIIAGGGAYLHAHFGKSEFQSSISLAYNSLESSAFGDNIKSSVFGGFWSNYYKYNITLLDGNILKPLGTIGIGISKASDWRGAEFRGGGFGDVFAHIGAGLEYVIFGKGGFYTLGIVGVQKLHSQAKAQISFANASTMLDFVVNNNAFEAQAYFIGSHTIKERISIEYAIHINGDTRTYYGTKGSVGFRYAF